MAYLDQELAADCADQLGERLENARRWFPPLSTWNHYKGGTYMVLGVAIDTDDGKVLVRYRRIAGPGFDAVAEAAVEFARPAREWGEQVVVRDPEPRPVDRFVRRT